MELKIAKLEETFANSRVLDKNQVNTSKVTALCKVSIIDIDDGKEYTYDLVSENEADIKKNRISVNSPIGKGLLGKSVGDKVKIKVPSGVLKYRILSIT